MPHATVNDHKSCYINFLFHRHELPYFNLISYRVTTYTVFQKKGRHQTRGSNSVNSIFKIIFTVRFSSKFAAKCLLKSPPHLICIAILPRETLTSENERQSQTNAVINDKLLGTVVTHLRCGEIFNNQIKKGLLPSLQVKLF